MPIYIYIYIYFRENSASCKSAQHICTGALYHLNTQKVYLDSVLRVSYRSWSYNLQPRTQNER